MSKHRHEQFREAWAVVRIDDFHSPETPIDVCVTPVKEVWLTAKQAEAEVERLNALWLERNPGDDSVRYFSQYTRLERDG